MSEYANKSWLEDRRIEVGLKQLLRPQEYQGFHFLQVTLLTQSLTTK